MLARFWTIAMKLLSSVLIILLFFYISSQLPYFQPDRPFTIAGLAPQTGHSSAGTTLPSTMLITDGDARFTGDFFDSDSNTGFTMREIDVSGPCERAGERYIHDTCPQCNVTPAISDNNEPPTLFWMHQEAEQATVGTVFRDCATDLGNGQVRVPLLSFNGNEIDLTDSASHVNTSQIPTLAGSVRESNMTLGNWAIAVDTVTRGGRAMDQMGLLLGDAGWREVPQGNEKPQLAQRVYSRNDSRLCVVTLNRIDEAFQLVTMMNI
jgi:hypothetical protein